MNIIQSLLKWLWNWGKGSKRRSHGRYLSQRHLGAKEKSTLDDVRNFLQEIRMQDKLPDILRQRNIGVEEFKRLEDLRQLYLRAKDGSPNAARELNERYSNDPVLYSEEMNLYNRIKRQMHSEGEDFVRHPDDPSANPITEDWRADISNRYRPPRAATPQMNREHLMSQRADEMRFLTDIINDNHARRMNRENPMSQEEIDNIMRENERYLRLHNLRERRRRGLPPYGGEGE